MQWRAIAVAGPQVADRAWPARWPARRSRPATRRRRCGRADRAGSADGDDRRCDGGERDRQRGERRRLAVERRPTPPPRRRRSPSPGGTRGARTRCPSRPARDGQVDRHAQLVRLRRGAAGCGPQLGDGARAASRSIDCSSTSAPSTSSGAPVSIAGEAFITLPPSVPTLRVDGEPTSALASASAGVALDDRRRRSRDVRASPTRRSRTPSPSCSMWPSDSMRSMATT